MVVDEGFRNTVMFLCFDVEDEITGQPRRVPMATAFLVRVPLDPNRTQDTDLQVTYLVTAKHVVLGAGTSTLYIRGNQPNGGIFDWPVTSDQWALHSSSDVAVVAASIPNDWGYKFIPIDLFATDEYIVKQRVSEGDEVFFVGLFGRVPGNERTQPIVRSGIIALMPREKISLRMDPHTETRKLVDAYLVEARSWGGHSGSPVLFHPPITRQLSQLGTGDNIVRLLGLVHGHYDIPQEVAFIGDMAGSATVDINAGIAIVIPAQAITEMLMTGDILEAREEHRRTM
jgi:Trypsin-like peptidase domain